MEIRTFSFTTNEGHSFNVPFIVDDDLYYNGWSPNGMNLSTSNVQGVIDAFKVSDMAWTSAIPFYYPVKGGEYSNSVISVITELFPNAQPLDVDIAYTLHIGDYSWGNLTRSYQSGAGVSTGYKYLNSNSTSSNNYPRFPIVNSFAGRGAWSSSESISFTLKCSVIPSSCIAADGSLDLSAEKLTNSFKVLSVSASTRNDTGMHSGSVSGRCSASTSDDYGTAYTLLNGKKTTIVGDENGGDNTTEDQSAYWKGLAVGLALYFTK